MYKTGYTVLCYNIAIILLMFGINFDRAEDIFCTLNAGREYQVVSMNYTNDTVIRETESESEKIIGTKNASAIEQIGKQNHSTRKDTRVFLHVERAQDISNNYSNSDRVTYEADCSNMRHRVAVLNYIHDLDGKK